MLRTIFVLACLGLGLRYSFRGPFYVLLTYLWLAYFRPDQWLWSDFILPWEIPLIVGAWVVVGTALSSEKLRIEKRYWLFLVFLTHSLLSTLISPHVGYSWPYWVEFFKIIVICTIIVLLVNTEQRLRLTLIIVGVSLGLEAAKQGFSNLVMNPGGQNTNTSTMLGDNNGVAVGMAMLVPILFAVASTARRRAERLFGYALTLGVLFRAIFTYSRGGFLAVIAICVHFLFRAKHRVAALTVAGALTLITASVLPQEFWERMGTIPTSTEEVDIETMERSAASRLHFWNVAILMANSNPILGVGHNAYNPSYNEYDFLEGEFGRSRSVHSAWFGILAELGYVGMVIYGLIVASAFMALRRVRRLARTLPALGNLAAYAKGLEAALLAFAVGASFVPFQYNEFAWHLFALCVATGRIAHDRSKEDDTASAPAPAVAVDQVRRTLSGSTSQSRINLPARR
jgi:putative inorganic carbon (HCO3(-)) transporter